MTIRSFLLAAAAIGCNGVHSDPQLPIDAAPDASPDADIDAPIALTPNHFVISGLTIPTSNTQARAMALDLNGDATTDNQLGMVLSTFAAQGFDVQAPATSSVDRGTSLMLIDLQLDQGVTVGTFTLFTGADPQPLPCNGGADPVCRHHLDGSASFTVSPTSARDTPLAGSVTAGVFLSNVNADGQLQFVAPLLATNPIALDLIGARAKVTNITAASIDGTIAGAVTMTDIDTKLLPGWQASFQAQMLADCPGAPPDCGCANGSQGKTLHGLYDTTPNNCSISLTELQNNSLIQSLLAPDVNIAGQDALSLGIAFTAVRATYTP